jgi:hypothetical protein
MKRHGRVDVFVTDDLGPYWAALKALAQPTARRPAAG